MPELIRCEHCGRKLSSEAARTVGRMLVCPACAPSLPPAPASPTTFFAAAGMVLLGELLAAVLMWDGADFSQLILPAGPGTAFCVWLVLFPRQPRPSRVLARVMLWIALAYPLLVLLACLVGSGCATLMLLNLVLWFLAAVEGVLFLVWLGLYAVPALRADGLTGRQYALLGLTISVAAAFVAAIIRWGLGA